jgi:hypothetical protein
MAEVERMEEQIKSGRGGRRPGAGRPKGTVKPTGKKMRSMRLTDYESKKVREYVKTLRK